MYNVKHAFYKNKKEQWAVDKKWYILCRYVSLTINEVNYIKNLGFCKKPSLCIFIGFIYGSFQIPNVKIHIKKVRK